VHGNAIAGAETEQAWAETVRDRIQQLARVNSDAVKRTWQVRALFLVIYTTVCMCASHVSMCCMRSDHHISPGACEGICPASTTRGVGPVMCPGHIISGFIAQRVIEF